MALVVSQHQDYWSWIVPGLLCINNLHLEPGCNLWDCAGWSREVSQVSIWCKYQNSRSYGIKIDPMVSLSLIQNISLHSICWKFSLVIRQVRRGILVLSLKKQRSWVSAIIEFWIAVMYWLIDTVQWWIHKSSGLQTVKISEVHTV